MAKQIAVVLFLLFGIVKLGKFVMPMVLATTNYFISAYLHITMHKTFRGREIESKLTCAVDNI